eukprot:m.332036 g.332036  ORF g.332036 m.332036 type:complete len:182 (-) comp16861_c0_seq1:71-616(-)
MAVRLFMLAALCATSLVAANNSSCGPKEPSPVKDCQNVDLGTCGNACCFVDVSLGTKISPDTAYATLKGYLAANGTDGSYSYVTGPDSAGHNPSDDLRQYNIPWKYILQGTHTTTGGYVDKININIRVDENKNTVLRMGSVAGIHGALGDNGQLYKTMRYMLDDGIMPGLEMTMVSGCGKK